MEDSKPPTITVRLTSTTKALRAFYALLSVREPFTHDEDEICYEHEGFGKMTVAFSDGALEMVLFQDKQQTTYYSANLAKAELHNRVSWFIQRCEWKLLEAEWCCKRVKTL